MNEEELFEEICDEIRGIDLTSEFPVKLQILEQIFVKTIKNEKILREIFDYFNQTALEDPEFSTKLSYVLNSNQFQMLEIGHTRVRNVLLNVLQKNFEKAPTYKKESLEKYYNSISLLGECYHRMKLKSGDPITILGKSLFKILANELEVMKLDKMEINDDFPYLILNQVVLNGQIAKNTHKPLIEQLMLNIRKCLIETENLSSQSRAFLTMTLDLYYSNFTNVGKELEEYYGEYLKAFEQKQNAKRKPSLKKPPLVSTLRDRLKISTVADLKFERPSLQIDKKVEKLVTQWLTTSPVGPLPEYMDGTQEISPKHSIKKESPKKVQPRHEKSGNQRKNSPKQYQEKSPEKLRNDEGQGEPTSSKYSPTDVKNSPQDGGYKNHRKENGVHEKKAIDSPDMDKSEAPQSDKIQVTNRIDFLDKNLKLCSVPDPGALTGGNVESENCNGAETLENDEQQNLKIGKSSETDSISSSSISNSKGTEDSSNVLRQQNSCQIIESSTKSEKEKDSSNIKVYFREENVENLTWDHHNEDDTPETPPKLNPYSSSFLSFLENQ